MKHAHLPLIAKAWWLTKARPGFSLVEVILSSAVFVLLVTGLLGAYLYGQEATVLSGNHNRAMMLAEEGLEASRNIRDASFANMTNGTFGLTTTSNQWNLSGSSDTTGIYNRTVTVTTPSSNRRRITSRVVWQQNAQRSGEVTVVTHLTNWQRSVARGSVTTSFSGTPSNLEVFGNSDTQSVFVNNSNVYLGLMRGDGSEIFLIASQ